MDLSRPTPKPPWLRRPLPPAGSALLGHRLAGEGLHTVCREAHCPNQGECLGRGVASFLILGPVCTRGCAFCAVTPGRPDPPDPDEPARLARAVAAMGLGFVVITSVTRDDLADGGAGHYAAVVAALARQCPGVGVELLVPDFAGEPAALATVLAARPQVLAHNLETVPRLYPMARTGADYARSLELLRQAKALAPEVLTKSGLMLGLGEERGEVLAVLDDLRAVGCDCLTLGQYLAPSPAHLPVARYLSPREFAEWGGLAREMGFAQVASAPLVRSSYLAEAGYRAARRGLAADV